MGQAIARILARLGLRDAPVEWASGGAILPRPKGDEVLVRLTDGRVITSPEEAEAWGLTADAKRMREERRQGL